MIGPPAAAFTLEFSAAGPGAQVALVGGAVALHEARELERGVLDGIRQGRTRVVLDLHGITDVGPGLLGVLLRIRRGVTQVDGRLAMVVAGPPVSDLARTTVLAVLIDIASDRQTALQIVQSG
jgi:anti-anti-sigma factor